MSGLKNYDNFMRKYSKLQKEAIAKPKEAALQIATAVERQAKINASTGSHKRGKPHIPGTGPGPNRVSNHLRDSIKTKGHQVGFDRYEASTQPFAYYAKAVEFGSSRWKIRSDGSQFIPGIGYPFFRPAVEGLRRMGAFDTILKRVWQGTELGDLVK